MLDRRHFIGHFISAYFAPPPRRLYPRPAQAAKERLERKPRLPAPVLVEEAEVEGAPAAAALSDDERRHLGMFLEVAVSTFAKSPILRRYPAMGKARI